MIKSVITKIRKIKNFDNLYIETELQNRFKSVIRWAVVEVDDEDLSVCVSYCA